eukprot:m.222995 g.222995  ORF g.222995 m.222995 type:complete len:540 (+) comp10861_c0_seq1:41-1660(+)
MSLVACMKGYVQRIVAGAGPGIKALLLDSETSTIVSLALPMSALRSLEVFLVSRIDARGEPLLEAKALVFIRPTASSVQALCKELRDPRFSKYYIYISNVLDPKDFQSIAAADVAHSVVELKEVFADVYALDPHFFVLNIPRCLQPEWDTPALVRATQGLRSFLLAFDKHPVIRYSARSALCETLAHRVVSVVQQDVPSDRPTLLILDRRMDLLTPILHQYTYQAMVHDLIGIANNIVDLSSAKDADEDMRQAVLSAAQDDFFARNMYTVFSETLLAMDELRTQSKQVRADEKDLAKQARSFSDIKRFFDNYANYKDITKKFELHTRLTQEILHLERQAKLMAVITDLETVLLTDNDGSRVVKKLTAAISAGMHPDEALRIGMQALVRAGPRSGQRDAIVAAMTAVCGPTASKIASGLTSLMASPAATSPAELFKRVLTGLYKSDKELEIAYTQHTPLLATLLHDAVQGRLSQAEYPFVEAAGSFRPARELYIFIVGGATFEEAKTVAFFNDAHAAQGWTAFLGGTSLTGFKDLVSELS